MNILEEFKARGLFSQCSNEQALEQALSSGKAIYAGFDPTAESLHVGNLIPILCLHRLSVAGFKTIALVGGATGLIGDPSGKAQERPESLEEIVFSNSLGVEAQLKAFSRSEIVNNLTWTKNLNVLEFMRTVGKHSSLSEMLARDAIKNRLDAQSGISFAEFSYMLFQANDFWQLSRQKDCLVQIGGSDQFGNMCSGLGLIARDGKQGAVLTFPLLTTADGKKFGKSEAGAVWLDSAKTSVWDFYQFWLNSADADVIKLLKMFTFLSLDEIASIEQDTINRPELRRAQKALAFAVTSFIHGVDSAQAVKALSEALFLNDFSGLTAQDILELKSSNRVPTVTADLSSKAGVVNAMVDSGLVESKTQANQLIKSKAVSLVLLDLNEKVEVSESFKGLVLNGTFLLKKGKKGFVLVDCTNH